MAAWWTGETRTRFGRRWSRSGTRIGTSPPTIESRVLAWIQELEQVGAIALEGNGEEGPDFVLGAKIRLSLIKLSSVNRLFFGPLSQNHSRRKGKTAPQRSFWMRS